MKSEEAVFTHFNLYFITFPRQVFVNIIDSKSTLGGLLSLIERMVYLHRQMENMKSLNTSALH